MSTQVFLEMLQYSSHMFMCCPDRYARLLWCYEFYKIERGEQRLHRGGRRPGRGSGLGTTLHRQRHVSILPAHRARMDSDEHDVEHKPIRRAGPRVIG